MRMVWRTACAVTAAAAGFVLLAVQPAAAQTWKFNAIAYAWLSGIDGTIGLTPLGGGEPVDATFSDLVGFLDFAAAGHFEARTNRVVLLTDINYVGLNASRDAEVLGQTVSIDMDYSQWIIELGGGYRISPKFDLLAVGRYYIQDLGQTAMRITGEQSSGITEDWGDLFVGARFATLLGEKWFVSVRGDIGAGGSQFAWFGNVAFGYRFSDLLSLAVAYRVLAMDYETDPGPNYYKYDVVNYGLGLALGFSF